MQTKEYRTVDKAEWPRGEWDAEPDKMQWQDEETGLACLMVRGGSGAPCGYVGVPAGHPLHGMGYNDVHDKYEISVHGGLTFSDHCAKTDNEARYVCHVPDEGEPDHLWWLGFDCAHYGDFCPAHARYGGVFDMHGGESYKTVRYTMAEVRALAKQISNLTPRGEA